MNKIDLNGRKAIITGGARGIGYAITERLLDSGASCSLWDRDPARLAEAGKKLSPASRVHTVTVDITRPESAESAAEATFKHFGGIDILVNNAGIQRRHPIAAFPPEDWDAIIATNLTAPFVVAQAVIPGMVERGRGAIVNVASLMSELGRPSIVPYTAAKGGVRQLTRGLATELGPTGVRVNAIAPGYFLTEMNRALIDDANFDGWVRGRTPMRRWGNPDELAGLAVFLCSDAASYITGQTIFVDGGMSIAV